MGAGWLFEIWVGCILEIFDLFGLKEACARSLKRTAVSFNSGDASAGRKNPVN